MKKITFAMSIIYDEEETHTGNMLDAIEHELFNIDGVNSWDSKVLEEIELHVELDEDLLDNI